MTNEEKFKGISQRLKVENLEFDSAMLSYLIITNYLTKFQELGILDGLATITESGKKIVEICNEFDWVPSDTEIDNCITEIITMLVKIDDIKKNKEIIQQLSSMVKEYKNDTNKFIKKYGK